MHNMCLNREWYNVYRSMFSEGSNWAFPDVEEVVNTLKRELDEASHACYLHEEGDIELLFNELSDVVIMAFTLADYVSVDFVEMVRSRADNNIERLERAVAAAKLLGCPVSESWKICRRMEGKS